MVGGIEVCEAYHQLVHGLKYCNDKVKEVIAGKICSCLLDDHKYCNRVQMEVMSATGIQPSEFIDKYGAYIRECLENGNTIDEILLELLDKKWKGK